MSVAADIKLDSGVLKKLYIPVEINFWDLKLTQDDDGDFLYDEDIFDQVLEANDLDLEEVNETDANTIIKRWYEAHVKQGGNSDDAADQFLEKEPDNGKGDIDTILSRKLRVIKKRRSASRVGSINPIRISNAEKRVKGSKTINAIIEAPSPEEIKEFRLATGMTQDEVVNLLNLSTRQLVSDYETGIKRPNDFTWTFWLLLTENHPTLQLVKKKASKASNAKKDDAVAADNARADDNKDDTSDRAD